MVIPGINYHAGKWFYCEYTSTKKESLKKRIINMKKMSNKKHKAMMPFFTRWQHNLIFPLNDKP